MNIVSNGVPVPPSSGMIANGSHRRSIGHLDKNTVGTGIGGAIGTALAPGVGTAIGAAVGGAIADQFPAPATDWGSAGAGVHDWYTAYAPEAFLNYAKANPSLGALSSIQAAQDALIGWLWQPGAGGFPEGGIVTPQGVGNSDPRASAWYSANTPAVYKALGVDYPATLQAIIDPTHGAPYANKGRAVMLPGAGTSSVPYVAVQQATSAANAANSGVPLTPGEAHTLQGMGGGVSMAGFGPVVIIILLLLLGGKLLK